MIRARQDWNTNFVNLGESAIQRKYILQIIWLSFYLFHSHNKKQIVVKPDGTDLDLWKTTFKNLGNERINPDAVYFSVLWRHSTPCFKYINV